MKFFCSHFLTRWRQQMPSWRQHLVLFTSLFLTTPGYAVTYYVANDGNDSNPGTSESAPWQTINRVNQAAVDKLFKAGDSILFKRGNIFFGQIYSRTKGDAQNRFTIGAYGNPTASKPIISGLVPINGWSNGNANDTSVCQADVSALLAIVAAKNQYNSFDIADMIAGKVQTPPKYLFLDGKFQKLARFPNEGFLFIDKDTKVSTKTLRDTELAAVPKLNQWVGGEMVLRNTNWTYINMEIKGITKNSLTSSENIVTADGWALNNGYFLQGKLAGLDAPGEWFLDEKANKLYFIPPAGTRCPDLENRITVSVFQTAASVNDYVTIENLHIEGYSGRAISIGHEKQYGKIDGCTIKNSYVGIAGTSNNFIEITNNTIQDIFNNGISFWTVSNTTISGNTVENIGLYPGVGGQFIGIRMGSSQPKESVKNVVSYNQVKNTGYSGIMYRMGDGTPKNAAIIEKNIVDHALMTLADGGSIYFQNTQGVIVRDNFLLNGVGNKDSWDLGKGHFDYTAYAFGIVFYGDENHKNQLLHNTIINHDEAFHEDPGTENTIMKDNVFYNNRVYQTKFQIYKNASKGVNYTVQDNIFYALDPFQWPMYQKGGSKHKNWNFGKFDRNYYCSPYANNKYIGSYQGSSAVKHAGAIISRHIVGTPSNYFLNLESYQEMSKQDAHSKTDLEKWTVFRIGDKLYEVQETLGENYISNGTFEVDTTPWVINKGSLTTENKAGMEGKALKVKTEATGNGKTLFNHGEPIPFEKDAYYLFSFTVMSKKRTHVEVAYREIKSSSSTNALGDKFLFPVGPEKKTYSYIFQANELAADMRMSFMTTAETPEIWLDDVSVYRVKLKEAMEPTEKSKIFMNPTGEEAVISLNGIKYRDLDGNPVQGNITLAPYSSQILINVSGTTPSKPPTKPTSSIVVKEDAYNGQVLGGTLYSLNSNGKIDFYQAGAWQSTSLNDLGLGMPAEGFAGNITGLVYMVQGNDLLPTNSVVAVDNFGQTYWYTANGGTWNTGSVKQVDALFSLLDQKTGQEELYSLDGKQIVKFDLPGTGGDFISTPPPIPLESLGFPSDEQVKIVSRNEDGSIFYLVTESNQIYTINLNAKTGWKKQ